MTHRRYTVLVAAAVGFALCLGAPAEAAESSKKKHTAAHSTKQRSSTVAARSRNGGVPRGPLYNGQDYIGDDPDPNIRSYLIRDMTRYGGQD